MEYPGTEESTSVQQPEGFFFDYVLSLYSLERMTDWLMKWSLWGILVYLTPFTALAVAITIIPISKGSYEFERWFPILWCAIGGFSLLSLSVNLKWSGAQHRLRCKQMDNLNQAMRDRLRDEVSEDARKETPSGDKCIFVDMQKKLVPLDGWADDVKNPAFEETVRRGVFLNRGRVDVTTLLVLLFALGPSASSRQVSRIYPKYALLILWTAAAVSAIAITVRITLDVWKAGCQSDVVQRKGNSYRPQLARKALDRHLAFLYWSTGPVLIVIYFGLIAKSTEIIWAGCMLALTSLFFSMHLCWHGVVSFEQKKQKPQSQADMSDEHELLHSVNLKTLDLNLPTYVAFETVPLAYLILCTLGGIVKSLRSAFFNTMNVSLSILLSLTGIMGCLYRQVNGQKCAGGNRVKLIVATNFFCHYFTICCSMVFAKVVRKKLQHDMENILGQLRAILRIPCSEVTSDHVHFWHLGRHIIHEVMPGVVMTAHMFLALLHSSHFFHNVKILPCAGNAGRMDCD